MNNVTHKRNFTPSLVALVCVVATLAAVGVASPARAAFHLWKLNEIYTNSDGTLQFVELNDTSGGQTFVGGQTITSTNVGGTQSHSFTIPSNLSSDTFNHDLLFATSGLHAAGAPVPDYVLPSNFLFPGGGSISFFGQNGGTYSALPTDGTLSRTWAAGNAVNSPTNFAGQTGTVSVPEPATLALLVAGGACVLLRRRARDGSA